jgi:hypothetical protein
VASYFGPRSRAKWRLGARVTGRLGFRRPHENSVSPETGFSRSGVGFVPTQENMFRNFFAHPPPAVSADYAASTLAWLHNLLIGSHPAPGTVWLCGRKPMLVFTWQIYLPSEIATIEPDSTDYRTPEGVLYIFHCASDQPRKEQPLVIESPCGQHH